MVQINPMSLRLKALFWELLPHRIKVKYFVLVPFVPGLGASAEALRFLLDLASSLERFYDRVLGSRGF